MDEPKRGEKLGKVWTHTYSVVGLVAALVSIIGFFGLHPGGSATPPKTPNTPSTKGPSTPDNTPPRPSTEMSTSLTKAPHPKGIGTLHLDGEFPTGQPMLSTEAIAQANGVSGRLILKDSRSARLDTVEGAMTPIAVDANHLVFIWRKGTRFVRGLRMTASTPHIHLTGPGIQGVDVPTDVDGKLNQTLVWPADRMFSTVEFVGPVEVDGHSLDGGITFGDLDTNEPGTTLPAKFTLDLPKPGEIVAAIKGEFTYPAGGSGSRYVVVQAVPSENGTPISWSAEVHSPDPTVLRTTKGGLVDKGLYAIRVLLSTASR